MTTPDSALCQEGEDIDFLASCAASGDWSLLLSGVVKPKHMSPDAGEPLAERLLEIKRDTPSAWPPKLSSLRKQYPDLLWPDYEDGDTIDPMEKAVYVLHSYYKHSVLQAGANLYHAAMESFGSDRAAFLLRDAQDLIQEVRQLGTAQATGVRFGADAAELMEVLIGTSTLSSSVTTPWPAMNRWFHGMFPPGLHAFYAQPKNGKSKILDEIAIHNSLIEGRVGLLVDFENPPSLVYQRLACSYAGVRWGLYQEALGRWRSGGGTAEDAMVLDLMATAVTALESASNLFVLGQDHIDRDTGSISNEAIWRLVEEYGAEYVCYDQVHEGRVDRNFRKSDSFDQRTTKVITDLATWGIPVFATTQENRSEIPRDYDWTVYTPQHTTVYGSSAASFKCTLLTHVRMIKLEEPMQVESVHGEIVDAQHLQISTPILQRGGAGVSPADRVYRLINDFDVSIVLDAAFGERLMFSDLARKQERLDPKRRRARLQDDDDSEEGSGTKALFNATRMFKRRKGDPDEGV